MFVPPVDLGLPQELLCFSYNPVHPCWCGASCGAAEAFYHMIIPSNLLMGLFLRAVTFTSVS